jgi:hypothetical protein
MWPYWLLLLIPAVGIVAPRQRDRVAQFAAWALAATVFVSAIGLRYQVGGDWGAYLLHFEYLSRARFADALALKDPGYFVINWLVAWLGGSIYWVNVTCGAILMAGVIAFARRQPSPWLALFVAVPYLIIVVGMGYTRQAAALGFLLLGLTALADHRTLRFVFWVLLGVLFHKSAVLVLPIAALAASRRRGWTLVWVGVVALLAAYLFVFESVESLWINYVEADYSSEGGPIRVAMNAVPATLFLLWHRKLLLSREEDRLWWWMSWSALACIPLVLLSSTATDRVALYLIPIQMFVFSRLHLIARQRVLRSLIVSGIVIYYALVQYIWLNFAVHARYWVPYRMASPF